MNIVMLLHLYQPHNQQFDILDRIVNECYRPLIHGLLERPNAKVCLNVSGVLINLFKEHGYDDLLLGLKELVARNTVEFTGSSMYHAFLPLLPKEEALRQVSLHESVQKEYLGKSDKSGFFSPELAINSTVLEVCRDQNYKWVAVEELAVENYRTDTLFQDVATGVYTLPRNKRVSSLILSASVVSPEELLYQTQDIQSENGYWFVVMDAETFGHHRIGHERFLFNLLDSNIFTFITPSELLDYPNLKKSAVEIRPCTWSNSEQDFWLDKEMTVKTADKSFLLWKDPSNPIHRLQWELTNHIVELVKHVADELRLNVTLSRKLLDAALASDQYWWASAKPWWSLEMIEQGAFALKSVVDSLPEYDKKGKDVAKSLELYRGILDQAFEWQRTGYIRKAHLDNSGTYLQSPLKDRTHAEWFNQLVLEFEYEMNKASRNTNFEQAIKWRDAIKKIKLGTDKYDVLHVVDELWSGRTLPWGTPIVKPFLQHDWHEFSEFAKEHFLNVSSESEFEAWKTTKKSANL